MLTKRLEAIISLIEPCGVLADVGCDHGFVGVAALERGLAKKVVFSDVSAPSLDKAKRLCEAKGLSDKAEFVVCNGTEKIANADCLVIAGMGGKETISILQGCKFAPHHVILQPMRNLPEVRAFVARGYEILSDRTIFDKKFYDLLLLTPGSDSLTERELAFGRSNLQCKTNDFAAYVKHMIAKTQNLLTKKADNAALKARLEQLIAVAEEMNL